MRFDRIEVSHGIFVIYGGPNGRGLGKLLDSPSGFSEYTQDDFEFSKVKSVKIGKASFNSPSKSLIWTSTGERGS